MSRTFLTIATVCLLSLPSQAVEWFSHFNAALAKARTENKHVLVNFTGSDWCGWCIRLRSEVFITKTFANYATTNLVCVEIDFPASKQLSDPIIKQNAMLKQLFMVEGYPTIFILNPDGKPIARTGYIAGGAELYIKHLDDLIKAATAAEAAAATNSVPTNAPAGETP